MISQEESTVENMGVCLDHHSLRSTEQLILCFCYHNGSTMSSNLRDPWINDVLELYYVFEEYQ